MDQRSIPNEPIPSAASEHRGGRLRQSFLRAYYVVLRVNRALLLLSAVAVMALVLVTDISVFARYVMRQPLIWTHPVASYLLLYVIFLATAETLSSGGHVRADFFVEALPRRAQLAIRQAAHVLGLLFVVVFASQVWTYAERAIRLGERDTSMLNVPMVYVTTVMPVGAVLMMITYVFIALGSFLGLELDRSEADAKSLTYGD